MTETRIVLWKDLYLRQVDTHSAAFGLPAGPKDFSGKQ
jgi:hypothetical protein